MCAVVRNNPKKILGYPSFASNYAGSWSEIKGGRLLCHATPARTAPRRASEQKVDRVLQWASAKEQKSPAMSRSTPQPVELTPVIGSRMAANFYLPVTRSTAPARLIERPRSPDYLR